jgi:hypothetical protein
MLPPVMIRTTRRLGSGSVPSISAASGTAADASMVSPSVR